MMVENEHLMSPNEQDGRKEYWQNELRSLGVEPKRMNEFNDEEELEALIDIIKQVYYQDYKTAYGSDDKEELDKSYFL
jgi:hypothetical protein